MRQIWMVIFLGGGAALFVATLIWPLSSALADTIRSNNPVEPLSGRQAWLLLRGFRVAAEAALLSQLIGVGLAVGLCRRNGVMSAISGWVALCTLLTPTYIHAYAWSLLVLPAGVATSRALAGPIHEWLITEGRAVWCLATWMSPIAAGCLAIGWREAGRAIFDIAQLDSAVPRAARTASHALRPWLAISWITCFAIALTEFAVCHLSLCLTWNTEILALMQDQAAPGGVLRLAWPLVVVVILCGACLRPFRRVIGRAFSGEQRELGVQIGSDERRPARLLVALWLATVLVLAAPTVIMLSSLQSLSGFSQLSSIYANHVRWSAIAAAGSVGISLWISLAAEYCRLFRDERAARGVVRRGTSIEVVSVERSVRGVAWLDRLILSAAILLAVVPPALVGDAFASAYLHVPLIRDHWIIVSLVGTARFGVIMLLALRIAAPRQLSELARGDGASVWDELWRVRVSAARRTIFAAAVAVFLLAFNEIAATLLVVPPNVGSLPKTLLNAIHFGRNDAVIAMCLSIVGVVGMGAFGLQLLSYAVGRHSRLSN